MINSDEFLMRELVIGHLLKRREYLWNYIDNIHLNDNEFCDVLTELTDISEQIVEFERRINRIK